MNTRETKVLIGLTLIALLVGVLGRDIWTPDEPRVTAIAMDMSRTGNIIYTTLAGRPFLEKPPLYFATGALAIRSFGSWTGPGRAVRLTSWLWMLGVLWMVFLLVRDLSDSKQAWWTLLVLSLFPGFWLGATWNRVDASLAFFVAAGVLSFERASREHHLSWFIVSGLCLGGAFLSKGPIGPLLTVLAWIPLFYTFIWKPRREYPLGKTLSPVILSFLVAGTIAGIWMLLLMRKGGAALFREWLLDNQLGRFTGAARQLGHLHRNPFYYLPVVLVYTLPFIGPLVGALRDAFRSMKSRGPLSMIQQLALWWSIGTMVILSIPATKRGIYLLPALPAFAILITHHPRFQSGWGRWRWSSGWTMVSISLTIFLLIFPFVGPLIHMQSHLPEHSLSGTVRLTAAILSAMAGWVFLWGTQLVKRPQSRTAVASITLLFGFNLYGLHVLNQAKELQSQVVAFNRQVPPSHRSRIAAIDLSETMQGALVVYADWAVPIVHDPKRCRNILMGRDPEFNMLLYTSRTPLKQIPGIPSRIVAKGPLGERQLFLIKGVEPAQVNRRKDHP